MLRAKEDVDNALVVAGKDGQGAVNHHDEGQGAQGHIPRPEPDQTGCHRGEARQCHADSPPVGDKELRPREGHAVPAWKYVPIEQQDGGQG